MSEHRLIDGFCPDCGGSCLVGFGNPSPTAESDCTRCGHEMLEHRQQRRRRAECCMGCWRMGQVPGCSGYACAVLPEAGERLEFGKHRLPQDESETAPAWPRMP